MLKLKKKKGKQWNQVKKNIQGFIVIAKSSEFNPTHDPPSITFLKI